jgi:hypothetical protein
MSAIPPMRGWQRYRRCVGGVGFTGKILGWGVAIFEKFGVRFRVLKFYLDGLVEL